jgi:putative hemolysin
LTTITLNQHIKKGRMKMNTKKLLPLMISLALTIWLLSGCGLAPSEPTSVPTPIPPPTPQTEAPEGGDAETEEQEATSGFITGRVHGQSPPTPPMVVYAVDTTTGAWAFTETQGTDGEAPFSLEVSPGTYQVFAFSEIGPFAGYASEDGWSLGTVTVAAGQTIADIMVRPPSQSECGSMFGLPASPDGRFAAVPGPSEECRAAVVATDTPVSGLANPASVFCEQHGGRVDIRDMDGGQVGFCVFPDSRECEEWTFFHGECVVRSIYQLPSPEMRENLVDGLTQALGMAVTTEQVPFQNYISGEIGIGWQATATGTGLDFESYMVVAEALRGALESRGWQEDIQYAGGGPTGILTGYRQANALCLSVAGWEPSEDADCPSEEPISACELAPEQQLYTITLTCAQDITAVAGSQPEPQVMRIQFAPGAISAQVSGGLPPNGVDRYVLTAMAGQEMTLDLSVTSAGDPAVVSAILVIWGADGTVLISDHAAATSWMGLLPATQDYFVDVRAADQAAVDYTLEVIIPPATSGLGKVPPTFQPLLGQLESTGVPPMLPPDFPGTEGLPPIYPHVLTAESGEYEISLGFGADCRGAGACHYGSLAGMMAVSNEPVSTRNFEFDAARAQEVTLAKGIQGYFVEGLCGASCDDSKVFWISDGFQYMVGMKAASQPDVVNLANATIENPIP